MDQNRDITEAQLVDGTLNRTEVKLMSASFIFRNKVLRMEIKREFLFNCRYHKIELNT